jgi:hypothetical protein
MADNTDSRIDDYILTLPPWQQEICHKVRRIVHQADPEVIETIKRSDRPYFTLQGNICALQGTKSHVNIFIYDPIAPDPSCLINQGQDNTTSRAIQVFEGNELHEEALLNLIRAVIANNKVGGWRKLKQE